MLGDHGEKALAPSGAAVVGQEFDADPIPLGRIATGLLDVLPVKVHTTPRIRLHAADDAHEQRSCRR